MIKASVKKGERESRDSSREKAASEEILWRRWRERK